MLPAPLSLLSPPLSFTYRGEHSLVEAAPEYHVLSFGDGVKHFLENSLRGEGGSWK